MGSAQARFNPLFNANYGDVVAYAVRRCRNHADAEDVTAETFAVAWRRLAEVPEGQRARMWLFGTARLVLHNHLRTNDRRTRLRGDRIRARRAEPQPRPEELIMEQDRIQQALDELNDIDREILQLHVWEDLDTDAIATTLDVTSETARKRLERARRRAAEALTAIDEDTPPRRRTRQEAYR